MSLVFLKNGYRSCYYYICSFFICMVELGKRLPQLRLVLYCLREEVVEYQMVGKAELPEEGRIDRFCAIIERDRRFKNLAS